MLFKVLRSPGFALLVCGSAVSIGCTKDGGPGTQDGDGTGRVLIQVQAVPAAVSVVTATVGTSTVTLTSDPNADRATGDVEVPEGSTEVLVQAYNGSNVLLYQGRDTVAVVANATVVVDVQLVCVNTQCDGTTGGTGTVSIYSLFPVAEAETNDLPGSCNTPNYMINGADPNPDNFTWMANGTVSTINDADYFCIPYVVVGDTITVQTWSSSLGSGVSSLDPFVALLTPSQSFAASDDNSGPGLESALSFIATQSGTWYVIVTTANGPSGTAPPRYTVRIRDAW